MSNPIDRLNEIANQRFEELKRKQFAKSRELPKRKITIDEDKIDKVFEESEKAYISSPKLRDSESKATPIDDIFSVIDTLKLSPNLSLAVSFVTIFELKKDKESLQKAIQILEAEL